jgi:hypothetical protein
MSTVREKALACVAFIENDMRQQALLGASDAALQRRAAKWMQSMSEVQPALEDGRCVDCRSPFVSERYLSPVPMQKFTCPWCQRFFLVPREIAAILLDVDERSLPGLPDSRSSA